MLFSASLCLSQASISCVVCNTGDRTHTVSVCIYWPLVPVGLPRRVPQHASVKQTDPLPCRHALVQAGAEFLEISLQWSSSPSAVPSCMFFFRPQHKRPKPAAPSHDDDAHCRLLESSQQYHPPSNLIFQFVFTTVSLTTLSAAAYFFSCCCC